jgi:phosphoribosylamine--glycine ligase
VKVLVVGGGGREHALAWKAAQSASVETVFVAPGNAGTAAEPRVRNLDLVADDIEGLLHFAQTEGIELAIVGPEGPLAAGIVDRFSAAGLRCFGPRRDAARLESSKSFCKDFLARHGIPTAAYGTFTDAAAAEKWIRERGAPIVVKADGLAAGKGVVVARSVDAAVEAVRGMLGGGRFGAAGRRVVVEEFLEGEEASFIVICDGAHVLPLASSQDHKTRDDGDQGPNTGGMGAYSPAPVVTPEVHRRIMTGVIDPVVQGMRGEGVPYTGFLYAGLMIAPSGEVRVLEFNCRFGDPETQPILMRLDGDIVELCGAAIDGRLHECRIGWDARAAVGVVLTAAGYPDEVRKGDVIEGLDAAPSGDLKIFHAGTELRGGRVLTAGGRVLCVTALGATVGEARERAYAAIAGISWPGMHFRRDIAHRALNRESGRAARAS